MCNSKIIYIININRWLQSLSVVWTIFIIIDCLSEWNITSSVNDEHVHSISENRMEAKVISWLSIRFSLQGADGKL